MISTRLRSFVRPLALAVLPLAAAGCGSGDSVLAAPAAFPDSLEDCPEVVLPSAAGLRVQVVTVHPGGGAPIDDLVFSIMAETANATMPDVRPSSEGTLEQGEEHELRIRRDGSGGITMDIRNVAQGQGWVPISQGLLPGAGPARPAGSLSIAAVGPNEVTVWMPFWNQVRGLRVTYP